jgi:hypothetical protein
MRLKFLNSIKIARLHAILLALMANGCGGASLNSAASKGTAKGSKPTSDVTEAEESTSTPVDKNKNSTSPPTLLLNATYKIRAGIVTGNASGTANNSAQVCDGDIAIQVNSSFGSDGKELLNFPKAAINCALVGQVDLQKALGSLSKGFSGTPKNPFITADNLLSVENLGPGTYQPARPILPSLLAASKKDLKNLDLVRTLTLSTPTKISTGTVAVKMNSYDEIYRIAGMDLTLPKVAQFTVTNTGFDGIDKGANFLFDSMTLGISTYPPAITTLSIQAPLNLLLAASSAKDAAATANNADSFGKTVEGATSGLASLVKIRIDLELVKQEGLDEAANKVVLNSNYKESIGGKSTGQ